jgi:hypothetical protein
MLGGLRPWSTPGPKEEEDEEHGRAPEQVHRIALADIELETIAGASKSCHERIEQAVLDQRLGQEQVDRYSHEHGT